jgi:hypothetical protein
MDMQNLVRAAALRTLLLLTGLSFNALCCAAPAPDSLQTAQADITAKHFQDALPLLDGLLKTDPKNGRALIALGTAHQGLGQTDAAADAYRQAYALPASARPAATALFLLYAGAKRADDAFLWFEIMHKGAMGDLSGLAENPAVRSLHGDPRFAMLFPDLIRFEPPFVQPVRIIHEWRGEQAGDEFGWIARGIGDVDGDGVTDVVISATGNPPYGDSHGKLYVYSGKTGKLLWKTVGAPGALLGISLEAAGDVDGDGIPDVIVGAPGEDAVYVFSGRDGKQLRRMAGDPLDHDFGMAAAGIGDFDHDGVSDLLVGAPSSERHAPGHATGCAYIYSGKTGKVLSVLEGEADGDSFGSSVSGGQGQYVVGAAMGGTAHHGRLYIYDRLDPKPQFVEDADSTGNALGYMFTSVLGDVDGDGLPDVYATDFGNAAKGPATGRVYVYSGKTGLPILTLTGDGAVEGFGIGAARAGDVDHDGHADLVVGSWQYHDAAWSGGRVQVFSGKDGHVLQDIVGKVPGETLGFDAVAVGDVDGDGMTDYLITSAWSGVNGLRSGRVYIVAGTVPAH